jgi:hypothetical protein
MVSEPKGSSAFDDPMRVDFPPQRTMPAALITVSTPVQRNTSIPVASAGLPQTRRAVRFHDAAIAREATNRGMHFQFHLHCTG